MVQIKMVMPMLSLICCLWFIRRKKRQKASADLFICGTWQGNVLFKCYTL